MKKLLALMAAFGMMSAVASADHHEAHDNHATADAAHAEQPATAKKGARRTQQRRAAAQTEQAAPADAHGHDHAEGEKAHH